MEVCNPVEVQDEQEEGQNIDIGDDDAEGGEDSGEAQPSRNASQPKMPSAEEKRIHNLTRCPH